MYYKMTGLTVPVAFSPVRARATYLPLPTPDYAERAAASQLGSVWWGKARSIVDKFYLDRVTNAKFVGMVDSDALFVTPVTRSDIFEGSRPIIKAFVGKAHNGAMTALFN